MRLLHTADWHLGKTLKGQNLLEDQDFIIKQIFNIIKDEKPDALIISGDIYDRAIPPIDAVNLFDETLTKLAEKKLPTLIIAGNHDSATRLNFGSKIFEQQGIFIAAKDLETPENVILEDKFGEIYFTMIPYFDFGDIQDKLSSARQKIPSGKRNVAIAHVFLTGGIESEESERKFVGGAANIDSKVFSGCDYVALGHLHCPQKISAENIRYAGSPLKYSFGETNHKKSVTIAEIGAKGFVSAEKIDLKPRRDVKIFTGNIFELMKAPRTEDYICARLTERAINVQDKLADIFPNLLNVEFHLQQKNSDKSKSAEVKQKTISPIDYFSEFFFEQTNEDLSTEYRKEMEEFLSEIEHSEREA